MSEKKSSMRLKPNSVTLWGALAMSAAFMGPAVSTFFNTPSAAQTAGAVYPLSMVVSLVAILFIANSVIEFSKKVPGAGFAFTFGSHGVGPKTGFMAGWGLLLGYGMISPLIYAGFGLFGSQFLERQFGWHVSWIIICIAVGLVISLLSYFGISSSAMATIIFLVLELLVLLALCFSVIFGGQGHNSIAPFSPGNATNGVSSIGLGMVFGILSFTGFEAAANLGEETKNAKRTIPRAIIIAVIVIGLIYVLGAYTAEIGFSSVSQIANDPSPFDTLARHVWGNQFAWLVDLTVLNSVFANGVAGQASVVRNIFSLGREGILPRWLGKSNSNGVPVNAIVFDFVLAMILGLSIGIWQGPWTVWTLFGGIMAISLILVYGIVSYSLIVFYKRKHPSEFSKFRHMVVPIIGMVLLLLPLYGNVWPIPAFPFNMVPYVVIVWFLIGWIYVRRMTRKQSDIVERFGSIFSEEADVGYKLGSGTQPNGTD